jgi:hypothetical protein
MATFDLTAAARTVLDDATVGDMRTTLGAGTMSNLSEDTTPQFGGPVDMNGQRMHTGTIDSVPVTQNSQSAAYEFVLSDNGKHVYHPSADTTARIWTIPANASVAYPIGATLTVVNDVSAGALTIAITSDTLVWADDATTGSRTIAAQGVATAIKMTATRWMISGVGLT